MERSLFLFATPFGKSSCSRSNFTALLEAIVHPECREGEEQLQLVETLNRHLRPDNYELQHVSNLSGRPVYKVRPARGGVGGSPKNIIFAADGPKPELVFKDAINNDIEIVENAEFCLVYNWPLDEDGLSWRKLASWWQEQQNEPDEASARKSLGARLFKSLDNPAEQKVFSVYYKHFASLNPDLPALIPHFCCTSSTSLRVQVLSGFEPTGSRSVAASGLLRKKGKCIADRRLQTPVLVGNSGPCRVWLCENNRPRRIEAR